MSSKAVSWAYQSNVEPSTRKFVLVALAERVGDDWSCYPLPGTLARDTGLTIPTVQAHLYGLEDAGFIHQLGLKGGEQVAIPGWRLGK